MRMVVMSLVLALGLGFGHAQSPVAAQARLEPARQRFLYTLPDTLLTAQDCADPARLPAQALALSLQQLFIDLPMQLAAQSAAERSQVRTLEVQVIAEDGALRLRLRLPVSAPQRLPAASRRMLLNYSRVGQDPCAPMAQLDLVMRDFIALAGLYSVGSSWHDGFEPILRTMPSPQRRPEVTVALPPTYNGGDVSRGNGGDVRRGGAPARAGTEVGTADAAGAGDSVPLLPSLQARAQQRQQQPFQVPIIPEVSTPSAAPQPYQPLPQPTPKAFRLNVSSSQVRTPPSAAEVAQRLQGAYEQDGVLTVPGYQQLAPMNSLRVTTFSEPQTIIDPRASYLAVLETSQGRIVAQLYSNLAPLTVNNFVFLSRHHFYDGVPFHRVVQGMMAQTGDPSGSGNGGAGYTFADEINPNVRHDSAGVLSMANSGPNSNSSQFFISMQPMPWLDDKHSIFGKVIAGLEVVMRLQTTEQTSRVPMRYLNMDAPVQELGLELDDVEAATAHMREGLEPTFTTTPLDTTQDDPESPLSLRAYLEYQLGSLPSEGSYFTLAGLEAVAVVNARGEEQVGVFAPLDRLERVYILRRLDP